MMGRMARLPWIALWLASCAWGCSGAPTRVTHPAAPPAYLFPLRAEDLLEGERISTGGHSARAAQALAKDLNVLRPTGGSSWSALHESAPDWNARRNEDSLIYGRPFHAMADGEVVGCWRNAPE